MKKIITLILVYSCYSLTAIQAQEVLDLDKDQPSNTGTLQEFDWLVGYWKGTGLGGECDELWLPAGDNSMIGTFRFFHEGALVFTEYMHLIEEDGKLNIKLKHFNRDLSAWEGKEEWTVFRFIKQEGTTGWFSGMTYHRDEDDLTILLNLTSDGVKKTEEFRFTKVTL